VKKLINRAPILLFALIIISLILFGVITLGATADYAGAVWPIWYSALFTKLGVLITLVALGVLFLFKEN